MSEDWVDGSYESGADDDANEPIEPAGSDGGVEDGDVEGGGGAELGIGEGSTFEPEEDVEAP